MQQGLCMLEQKDKIVCETPTPGKKPTRIDKWKYDLIRGLILKVLPKTGKGLAFKDLPRLVGSKLTKTEQERLGSVSWYTTVVKLDLEVRGDIHRVPGVSPQHLLKA